ncbi:transmembrane protein, putative (macronuclear) [Tetrahymena thermophila SB210]|uniref:Transmembrane protein, putative n=1 Tax=Tetrahymena thermophila (strain SB210) TaxID=312017 RepID=Q23QK2_TETTS|nr:transmembrane protein, putative [Tetrahymena thermophila SB210]EAR98886.3 transmembrane protein, putative [Tetrahymena thermophila SB210]|eukprot:XP_001019131.3 transmembrane protein, putative [Tetrahymena thermophila SB210]
MGKTNPFDSSYLQVINFENKMEKSYSLFRQTINLKLQILSMMKQKNIAAIELISKIESLKKGTFQKYLNRQNEDDILSSMINSDKFDEKTCIIFASYNDTENLTINQVSSNFYNLFCFTSRDHIYDKNIESIIPLAFQSVHKMYIKQYLEDSITCDIYSNDTNKQLEQNEQNNEIDENEKIIFASLNQMFILPIKIDIRTNEYKENGKFGLVAKIKQINEEYQYILFNETDLNVIGLTQQMHEIFFPNCNNLQKINLRQIFPFLIGTQNKTKIEDSLIQNNETICNTTKKKKQFHVNLTDDTQYILRGQLKVKNKFSFIIIQQADETKNTFNTPYRSTKRLNKAKSYKEISSYSFNYVELFVRKIKYHGVNNVSYVEVVKMRQLNPASQAQIILQEITNVKKQQIYSQLFEYPSQLQKIISELELNQNINSYLQFNSFYTQLQYSSRNFNQGNQLIKIKENDTPIDFTQVDFNKQQQLLKTLGDESTNLEQFKISSNRIRYDDFNYQSEEMSRLTLNQFREQKILQKLNEKLQLNQLYQMQSNIAQEQTFIQLFQENQISNSDLQIKVDFANKNLNHQNPREDYLNKSSTYDLPSPQIASMNINSNQQSLAQLSDYNLDAQQIKSLEFISNKENIYLDVETSNDEINKKYNNAIMPLKMTKNPNKIFKSNSFRKNKINNTLNDALSDKEKKKLMKNSYQHNNVNQIQKHKKKQQVQDIIYDIASNTSQNSNYTPVKRQLTQIMADQSTLKVINLIKIIGVICFNVMICITWSQFNSMYEYLSETNQDYEDFGWPTTYSSSLSDILKYKNIQFLTNYTRMNFTDIHQKQFFYDQIQQNMENTFSDVLKLLVQMEIANSQREVFNRVIENKMTFYFGQLYNTALLNSTTSNSADLVQYNYSSTLQYSIILNVQNIFRYIRNLAKVYQLRSYLLQNIAMHFNVLLMKAKPRFKPMKPEIYYDYLQTLIQQQEDISKDIQWIINSQYSDQRFNQELYDNFFFSAIKTNLCQDFKNYPQFNTNPKKINVDLCASPVQKFLQKGFSVAYKSLFSTFTELYNIYIIPDDKISRQKLELQLIGLIVFQMVLMLLVFIFGWITFIVQ